MARYSATGAKQAGIKFDSIMVPILVIEFDSSGVIITNTSNLILFPDATLFNGIVSTCDWTYNSVPSPVEVPATHTIEAGEFTFTITSDTGQYVTGRNQSGAIMTGARIVAGTGVRYRWKCILHETSTDTYYFTPSAAIGCPSIQYLDRYGTIGFTKSGFPIQTIYGLEANSVAGTYNIYPNSSLSDYIKQNIVTLSTDPYEEAGASGPGGGDGTFDFSSTPIDFPGLPTIGAFSTGFLNVYVPTAAQLRSLAAYMWAGAFDIQNFRKLVADPMDAIMGISIVPVTSSEIGVESTTLIVGNISTGISMPRALSQYVAVDCGTIEMPAKWGAYLDFSPYTKLQLYLPYIGFVDISPDDVMTANEGNEDDKMYPGTIGVQYHVDILSGSCIAFVKCRDHVIYEFGGQCACSCPVTEGQYKNGLLGMLEIISTVASTASAVTGGPGAKATKANREASKIGKIGAVAEGTLGVIDTSLAMIKPNITRSGSVGGSNGLMGYQIPYLVLTVPHMCIPGDQNVYIGYPSFVTLEMSELAGFTQIQITHLHNMSCTSDEADEIISLLSEGVIF